MVLLPLRVSPPPPRPPQNPVAVHLGKQSGRLEASDASGQLWAKALRRGLSSQPQRRPLTSSPGG